MKLSPSPGNSIAVVVHYNNEIGKLSELTTAIANVGGSIGIIDVVKSDSMHITRSIVVDTTGDDHAKSIVQAVKAVAGVEVIDSYDCTFKLHEGGKLDVVSRCEINNYADLSMAYTPGVARVCTAIQKDPSLSLDYTIRNNTVGIVTNGTAVLGLGNIGAVASLPVMEGKACLFKIFGGVNAFPVCIDTTDIEVLIETTRAVSATFGGINLEDIAAPVCFEVERRVSQTTDIPIFHDDQHGAAVVVGAAFINAVKVTGKNPADIKAVICGAGAAGVACTRALKDLGIGDIIVCDKQGAIYRGCEGLIASHAWLAEQTNKENLKGTLQEVLKGSDLFLGLSAPNLLTGDDIRTMNPGPIVFSLANPIPEVPPEAIMDYASVVATGRSDYPNQINNVLCFPGLFRGVFEARANKITREMLSAAARAIASAVKPEELSVEYIIPSALNKTVCEKVAQAVVEVAKDPSLPQTPIYFEF
ncbi:MAG: NAD-dependent malic enzyme [Armatimonadetes bacterium]|nr:NAD-dependent malic enzyme [Armatimonadota bacterium]